METIPITNAKLTKEVKEVDYSKLKPRKYKVVVTKE